MTCHLVAVAGVEKKKTPDESIQLVVVQSLRLSRGVVPCVFMFRSDGGTALRTVLLYAAGRPFEKKAS